METAREHYRKSLELDPASTTLSLGSDDRDAWAGAGLAPEVVPDDQDAPAPANALP